MALCDRYRSIGIIVKIGSHVTRCNDKDRSAVYDTLFIGETLGEIGSLVIQLAVSSSWGSDWIGVEKKL